ncbi:uncharacterized protein VTP21DRAFT_9636 [Calcarisporiella thermophila]|uniref:uncharacterized protein n=1 Tax=Calcarisporiella thermophila TaxID=911321 RepID=UPI0037421BC5
MKPSNPCVLHSDSNNAAESSSSRTAPPPPVAIVTSTSSIEGATPQALADRIQKQSAIMEQMFLMFGRFLEKSQPSNQPASPGFTSPISVNSGQSNSISEIHRTTRLKL